VNKVIKIPAKMSFINKPSLQSPLTLKQQSGKSWSAFLLNILRLHRHKFSDHLCLRTIRCKLFEYMDLRVPPTIQDDLFLQGSMLLKNENLQQPYLSLDDLITPDMFVLYMFVNYKSEMKHLEIPEINRQTDRVTVLDILYNMGTPYGHYTKTLKIQMFDSPNLSIEESYLTKRVLRGFRHLNSLVLWRACDDAMLQIIGITCQNLESIDLWKSANVSDHGVEMLLALGTERKTSLCHRLVKVMIKDTSVTDQGSYDFLYNCPKLQTLEFSHGSFIKPFLNRVIECHLESGKVFPALKSIFLPTVNSDALKILINSFPQMEELSLWTSLSHLPNICFNDLSNVQTLKIGGLSHSSILREINALIGCNITHLKIETVHVDISIDDIGQDCPNIIDLSVINARIKTTQNPQTHAIKMFSSLRKVYFFLVNYIPSSIQQTTVTNSSSIASPAGVAFPATGHTALHTLLKNGLQLENIQVTGTTALTDTCLEKILSFNPFSHLRRFVLSNPSVTHEQPLVVPLTYRSVNLLQKACPLLHCLGDLQYWAVSPAKISPSYRHSADGVSLQQNVWTKVQISGSRRMIRSSSVLYQGSQS